MTTSHHNWVFHKLLSRTLLSLYAESVSFDIIGRKTIPDKTDVEELEWPVQSLDLNPTEFFWDKLEKKCTPDVLHPRSLRLMSGTDITKAHEAE